MVDKIMKISKELKDKSSKQKDHVTATFRRTFQRKSLLSDKELKPLCLALISFDNKELVLESAWSSITIEGKEIELAFKLLKMCDGTKNITEIIEKFHGEISKESALDFLESLQKHSFVCDSREAYLLLHQFGCNPSPYYQTPTDADILTMLSHSLEESIRNAENEIQLPTAKTKLTELLSVRSSCREYDKEYRFSIKTIVELLWCMYGITNRKEIEKDILINSHTVPSGGALYPLEIHIAVTRENPYLSNSIYRYMAESHSLILWSKDVDKVVESIVGEDVQESIRDAGILLIISGYFPRSSQKYSNRGYLYTLYEVGAVMQNTYLVASELNLGCCAIGGFKERLLSDALRFTDYPKTMPFLTIVVGKPKEVI
jgi:SagB-type dehydrogenase family enzyme